MSGAQLILREISNLLREQLDRMQPYMTGPYMVISMSRLIQLIFCITLFASAKLCMAESLSQSDAPFVKGSKITNVDKEAGKLETGKLNGIGYKILYSKNGAIFGTNLDARLTVSCSKDSMTDRIGCAIFVQDLTLLMYKDGEIALVIGGDHYPGTTAYIRIESENPIAVGPQDGWMFSDKASKVIVNKILRAKKIRTKFQKWPEQGTIDRAWDVKGLKESIQFVEWAFARIK